MNQQGLTDDGYAPVGYSSHPAQPANLYSSAVQPEVLVKTTGAAATVLAHVATTILPPRGCGGNKFRTPCRDGEALSYSDNGAIAMVSRGWKSKALINFSGKDQK